MKNLQIRSKVVIVAVVIIVLLTTILAIRNMSFTNSLEKEFTANERDIVYEGVMSNMDDTFAQLHAALIPITHDDAIKEAFSARDRERLATLTTPLMDDLASLGVEQFQFHLPDATSFLRVHNVEKFGDDLSSFRHTVVVANRDKETVEGLEGGVAGAGFRHVVPMFGNNNELLGTVELGLGLNEALLDRFKENYGGEWAFVALDGDKTEFLLGTNEQKTFVQPEKKMIQALQKGQYVQSTRDTFSHLYIPLIDFSDDVQWALQQTTDIQELIAQKNQQRNATIFWGVGLAIVSALLLAMIIYRLLRPLQNVTAYAERLANGDLSGEPLVVHSNDEVGTLSHAFNKMADELRKMMKTIHSHALGVSSATEELHANSENTTEAIEEIARAMQDVTDVSEQQKVQNEHVSEVTEHLVEEIHRVTDSIEQVAQNSVETTTLAQKGRDVVLQSAEQMERLQQSSIETEQSISLLEKRSREVGRITEMITEIAEQTNLLALNASIEAARAGEHGQGFSVVAQEVRKLAEESNKAGSEVYTQILDIQRQVEQTVTSSHESHLIVQKSLQLNDEAKSAFEQIFEAIEQVTARLENATSTLRATNDNTRTLIDATNESEQLAERSTQFTHQVAAASEEQYASIHEISSAIEHLTLMADELNDLVQQFRTDDTL